MKFWAAEAAAAAAAPTPLAPRLVANHFRHPTTGGTPRGRTLADGVSVLALCICLTPVLLLTLTIRPSSGFQSSLQDQPAALLANPSSGLPSSGVSSTTTATNLGDLNIANGNLTPFNVAAMAFGGNQSRLTEEQSQAQYSDEMSLYMAIEIANSIIFVIGLCGNTIVILVILKFTKIETVTDIYILNLAFADLMFIMGLLFLNTTMHISQWIFGNLMCKVRGLQLAAVFEWRQVVVVRLMAAATLIAKQFNSPQLNLNLPHFTLSKAVHGVHIAESIRLQSFVGCDELRQVPGGLSSHICTKIPSAQTRQDYLSGHLGRLSHTNDAHRKYPAAVNLSL